MSKDEIIASKDAEIAFLRETIARLTQPKQQTAHAARQERYRERHKSVTSDVTSDRHSDVSPSPLDGPLGSPNERSNPVLTPLNPPTLAAAAPKVPFDETKAREYAEANGYNGEIPAMIAKFLNHHDTYGWKGQKGPIKDRMAAWRTWVGNELERNPPPAKPSTGPRVWPAGKVFDEERRLWRLNGVLQAVV